MLIDFFLESFDGFAALLVAVVVVEDSGAVVEEPDDSVAGLEDAKGEDAAGPSSSIIST